MFKERKYWSQLPGSVPKGRGHKRLHLFWLPAGWNDDMITGLNQPFWIRRWRPCVSYDRATKVDWGWVPDMLSALPTLDHYLWTSIWKRNEYSLVKAMFLWISYHPQPKLCPYTPTSMSLSISVPVLGIFFPHFAPTPCWSFKFLPRHHLLCCMLLDGISNFLLYDSFASYFTGSNYWALTVCQALPWILHMHSSFNPYDDIWDG